MKSKKIVVLLSIALCCSIILNIVQFINMRDLKAETSIVGTFCSGTGPNSTDLYYTFYQDGTYVQFEQYHFIEKGTYQQQEQYKIILSPSDTPEEKREILFLSDVVYALTKDNVFFKMSRISELPMLINVNVDEK